MRNKFVTLSPKASNQDVIEWCADVARNRDFDVADYQNQVAYNPVIYAVPASSSDLRGNEKAGDIAVDASYFYIVVDDSGTLEWRRAAIGTF